MFAARKKPTPQPPHHPAPLQKLLALPPAADLLLAAGLGGFGLMTIYGEGARFLGVVCLVIALAFAMLGIAATQRDMKAYKIVAAAATPQDLRALSAQHFEKYLIALFSLAGYQVRSGADELHRQDDADLIAVRRKEVVLIQFNHFDEENVSIRALQSLYKAGSLMRVTNVIAITLGEFAPDAASWASRKGVRLMTEQDILQMAAECTGAPFSQNERGTTDEDTDAPMAHVPKQRATSSTGRILFIDFADITNVAAQLPAVLEQLPAYNVVASTLVPGDSLDTLRSQLGAHGSRIIDALPPSSLNRYFAIQEYLRTTTKEPRDQWLAIDSHPQMYPEGSTELVTVNPTVGLDAKVVSRVLEATMLADRRAGITPA